MTFPLRFTVRAAAGPGLEGPWTGWSPTAAFSSAVPPAFGGSGGATSPEDLLALAGLQCFIGTFKVLAENSRLTFDAIQGRCSLVIDRSEQNRIVARRLELTLEVMRPADPAKAARLLRKVAETAIVLNAIHLEREYHFFVDGEEA